MIAVIAGLNLAVVFIVELVGLATFSVWGAQAVSAPGGRWMLAIILPIVAIVVWAMFCAPKARVVLPSPVRRIIKLAFLAAASLALAGMGHPDWAIAFAAVALVTALIARLLPSPFAAP